SLYFIHYNSNTGFEVYKTDGTQEGTSLAFEIVGGPGSTSPEYLQVSNGFLWFGYYDDDEEKMTLARSSGSGASIIMAYEEDDAPKRFTDLGLKTLFTKYDRAQGNGLWITEGFASSTRIIKVVNILDSKCSGCPFPKDGGYVYFPAQTYYSGIELWRSNGTEFGTQQIINLNPGEANSNPKEITPNGNGVFFVADDGKHGYELWKSNLGVVGLEEEEHIQVAFEIFPNPTGGIIQLNSEEPLAGIWITDVLGKVIFQENNPSPSSSHSLDLSQYSNGLYILTVVSQSGGKNSKRLMLDK
ncbi:MAG: T9SS type A sorting domain-containing protein, partial [Luteibaculum sp.]